MPSRRVSRFQDGAQIVLTDVTMTRNTRLIGMAPAALTGAPSFLPTPLPSAQPTKTTAPTTPSPSTYHPTNSECQCVDTDDGATDSAGLTCSNFEDTRQLPVFELVSRREQSAGALVYVGSLVAPAQLHSRSERRLHLRFVDELHL